jgi:hypothetical protein
VEKEDEASVPGRGEIAAPKFSLVAANQMPTLPLVAALIAEAKAPDPVAAVAARGQHQSPACIDKQCRVFSAAMTQPMGALFES